MYDPTDDIKRAKIGRKNETLNEVIHPKKAETNLPPLKSVRKGSPKKKNIAHSRYCNYPGCYNSFELYFCNQCGMRFCQKHRLGENHNCTIERE